MKPPLCVCALVVFSLLNCDLFAGGEELSPTADSKHSDAAIVSSSESGTLPAQPQALIPGPQRSFLRMAGVSQKIAPEEVLPLLSRNVFTEGYDSTRPTEFLSCSGDTSYRPGNCRTWLRAVAWLFGLRIVTMQNHFCAFSVIEPNQTAALLGRPCRRTTPRGLSWPSIPDFPSPNWNKHCKAVSRSSTRSLLPWCRCSSPKATGPRQAKRTTKKTARTCWTRY